NTDDLFVGKTLLHGDVLMWLMKTLLTSGCTNQRGAGHEVFMKGQVDIELQRLIRARYNTAVENWSEWKWLEIGHGVVIIYLG
ncbi:hypothetical protein ACUNEX_21175, partial [Serratia sp. IR-2025]